MGKVTGPGPHPLTSESRYHGLRRPLWWVALALLVVNDHVLKGAGVVPGWLTGKLSDVAGLVVAPVLVASVLPVRTRVALWAAFASVVAPFVAINVSTEAADLVVGALSAVGVPWRIWSDPSDLLALAVLPLSLHVATAPSRGPARPTRPSALHRLGAMAGAIACLATSYDFTTYRTAVYLVNTRRQPVDLEILRAADEPDCAALLTDPEGTVAGTVVQGESCLSAESFEIVPLDGDWTVKDRPEHDQGPLVDTPRVCDVVVLRAPGLTPVAVFWNDVPQTEVTEDLDVMDDERALYLEAVGDRLFIERNAVARVVAAPASLPARDCREQAGGAP